MKKIKKLTVIALLATFAFGCTPESETSCYQEVNAKVEDVQAPTTVPVNQEFDINVLFIDGPGCGVFKDFVTVVGTNNVITSRVVIKYPQCSCDVGGSVKSQIFTYTPTTTGTYTFRFNTDTNDYITRTIVVE